MVLRKLTDYDVIIGVDLSFYKSGISVYDPKTEEIISTNNIVISDSSKTRNMDLYNSLFDYFEEICNIYPNHLIVLESPPMCSHTLTMQALYGLNSAHALIQLVFQQLECNNYERTIHAISHKAVISRLSSIPKVSKEQARTYVCNRFNLDESSMTLDVGDSISVIVALIEKDFNLYLNSLISKLENHKGNLKRSFAIDKVNEEIKLIMSLY